MLSELSHEYTSELRQWIAEMESEAVARDVLSDGSVPGGTTRMLPPDEPPTQILPLNPTDDSEPVSDAEFEINDDPPEADAG